MNNHIFDSTQLLLEQLAEDFLTYSKYETISHISLSGGSTPILLFKLLASSHYAHAINWRQLHFWWGDERCVPPTNPESNYGHCKQLLFDNIDIPSGNIHRIVGEAEPQQEAERYAQEIIEHVPMVGKMPQFDWIILGMGEDGHTASLFPGQTNYADPHLTIVAKQPQSGQIRISKTARLIEHGERITYLVLGENKAEIINTINTQKNNDTNYPAAHITSEVGLTQWYLDQGSAKLLLQGNNL